MNRNNHQLLAHHGRKFEDFKKAALAKFAFSFLLLFSYLIFSYQQESEPDLKVAIIMLAIPFIGFIVLRLSRDIESLERMLFFLKAFSITTVIVGANAFNDQSTGFQIRVVFLYAILYFSYLTDFLYIDKFRFYFFILFGTFGVLLLPADLVTKIMLFLAMIFMSVIAYDTVRLREQNAYLTEELRQSSEDTIYKLSHFDSLTGLPNRTLFNELTNNYQQDHQQSTSQVAILAIGIDGFKAVNETFGHRAGDNVLKSIAQRINQHFTGKRSLISRHEGDHFTVALMDYSDLTGIEKLSKQLLHNVSEPIKIDGQSIGLTCSIGIALKAQDDDSYSLLIQQAETAMNEAKIKGRNRYLLYNPKMLSNAKIRLRIESALRQAVKQQQGFSLYYQPKIDIRSGKVCGAEALIRWQDKDLGAISPVDFIPTAENSGLIIPLGRWIYQQVLQDMQQLQHSGLSLPSISVNLSARQFDDPELLTMLLEGIKQYNINPQSIDIELTESVIMRSPHKSINLLKKLRDAQMTISIDDFGIAYSSLSYLKSLPANRLKIDKSFIDDIVHHKDDQAITSGIINMGHNLGLSVLAEGVETAAQLDILKELGCDEIQGFYFSKPLPFHELTAFLKRSS
ncbi:bifunctional diguanylate cyclase/phosphodiesterase [Thiomicrorhabdus sp. 6S2-11]|uniref:Bifunctional diguanylate cyclase/phosphodiesterase n=1 Tax=Thiomicrorhabdus marina TaxID=2818442 RepID=A0ABS3Q3F7_9GAMM|nr:bifunctional diguanylate cyclase/phosphodiesterase [Thiomicrorhabdus marina]MBO1926862.1 bifunctional diguanylate cyclase/phosphodiesterase [Thiomicrorhabdus marina]